MDGMYCAIKLCLFWTDSRNSTPEIVHFSPYLRTAVAILTEFRAQLCVISENAVGATWPVGTKQGMTPLTCQLNHELSSSIKKIWADFISQPIFYPCTDYLNKFRMLVTDDAIEEAFSIVLEA